MQFHRTTAQLIFLSQRPRCDIQPDLAFLTIRVKNPDEYYWRKLRRVLRYLNGTFHMKLTLSVDNMSILNWFVDASHITHMECKGHVGIAMTLGKGAVIIVSA